MLSPSQHELVSRIKQSRIAMLAIAILVLFALFLDGRAAYSGLVKERGTQFDFYPRWVGVRAMLFEGMNPYSEKVTERIHIGMDFRGDHSFLYPAYIAFTIPHFLLPYPHAITLWIVTQHVMLILSVLLIMHGRAHSLLLVGGAILAAIIYPFNVMSVTNGQFTIFMLFFLSLAYWLWKREQYMLAGCALTQVLIKPQMTFLVVGFWLLLALKERRWSFLAGFGITMGILTVLPMFFMGNWLDDFLASTGDRRDSALEAILPGGLAPIIETGLIVSLWSACLLLWLRPAWKVLKKLDEYLLLREVGYLISLTLTVTALTTPRLRNYDLPMLLFSVIFGVLCLQGYRSTGARLLRIVLWGTLLVVPIIDALAAPSYPDPFLIDSLFILMISGILFIVMLLLPGVIRSQEPEQTVSETLAGQT